MIPVLLTLVVALPISWFVSEFYPRRWLRLVLGCSSIALCFLVAFAVGKLEYLNANAWYGAASKKLIEVTLDELRKGHVDKVAAALEKLHEQFHPTYENRARYDKLVESYAERLSGS